MLVLIIAFRSKIGNNSKKRSEKVLFHTYGLVVFQMNNSVNNDSEEEILIYTASLPLIQRRRSICSNSEFKPDLNTRNGNVNTNGNENISNNSNNNINAKSNNNASTTQAAVNLSLLLLIFHTDPTLRYKFYVTECTNSKFDNCMNLEHLSIGKDWFDSCNQRVFNEVKYVYTDTNNKDNTGNANN